MKAMEAVTAKARQTARERLNETNEQMRQITEYQNQYYQEEEDWNEQQGYVLYFFIAMFPVSSLC